MAAPRLTNTLLSSFSVFCVSPSLIWRGFLVTLGQAAYTTARPASTPAPTRFHSSPTRFHSARPAPPPSLALPALRVPSPQAASAVAASVGGKPSPQAASAAQGGLRSSGSGFRSSGSGLPFQRVGLPFQRLGRVYKCKTLFIVGNLQL